MHIYTYFTDYGRRWQRNGVRRGKKIEGTQDGKLLATNSGRNSEKGVIVASVIRSTGSAIAGNKRQKNDRGKNDDRRKDEYNDQKV
jgi:hypothetical protein